MPKTNFNELLDAGVHFGHLRRKWNPNMAPYIFMEKNGIHIIDLEKTLVKLDEASRALKQIAKSGRKILFVATKKQAQEIVAERVKMIDMPYVTERWPGGMLTNFPTIRKAIKKMGTIDKMATDGTFANMSKREKLQITRQRAKLEKNLGSIVDMTRLPAALFVVDILKENIAVREAHRLNIPVFGMVDTNSDPLKVDFPIPANDDASKSISLIVDYVTTSIQEGLDERKMEREKEADAKAKKAAEAKAKKEAAEKKKEEERLEKEKAKKAENSSENKAATKSPVQAEKETSKAVKARTKSPAKKETKPSEDEKKASEKK